MYFKLCFHRYGKKNLDTVSGVGPHSLLQNRGAKNKRHLGSRINLLPSIVEPIMQGNYLLPLVEWLTSGFGPSKVKLFIHKPLVQFVKESECIKFGY